MSHSAQAFVVEAQLHLLAGVDPAAVGAAVTTELCGHWEHEGPCRWPHNNQIEQVEEGFTFRTLFIAPSEEEHDARNRIEDALRRSDRWEVVGIVGRDVAPSEAALAARLARSPRSAE
jgi:hypothetical protein